MAKSTTTEATPATPVSVTDVERPILPAEDYLREQEKGASDPAGKAVEPVTKAEQVDIAPGQPYPTGGAKAEQGVPHNTPPKEE